jgi:hypothetical protein
MAIRPLFLWLFSVPLYPSLQFPAGAEKIPPRADHTVGRTKAPA